MKFVYRGFGIEAKREKCMGGWPLLYFSIFRQSDGYECLTSFEDSAETVVDKIKQLKERVDAELEEADPWGERADDMLFAGLGK